MLFLTIVFALIFFFNIMPLLPGAAAEITMWVIDSFFKRPVITLIGVMSVAVVVFTAVCLYI